MRPCELLTARILQHFHPHAYLLSRTPSPRNISAKVRRNSRMKWNSLATP